jgi:DNA mismatch repair ATPase MutS
LENVVQPVAVALERYQRVHARPLAALAPELAFYLGAAQMQQRLAAGGLTTCLPTVTDGEHELHDAFNPGLALQLAPPSGNGMPSPVLIRNPIDFERGRIIFLTGPNRGGKTTYLRAVGLNQVLFQAGVFVAAAGARMTPADAILTHFPPAEGVEPGGGRLDDEARRMREIFDHATPRSLLLFNEPLTSTAEREALLLATDVLRALRLLGARTIFVTHLHALAEQLDALNLHEDGATVASWVAEVEKGTPTYTIQPGKPLARSHASRIAEQHGITFEQLCLKIQELKTEGLNDSKIEGSNN